VLTAKYEVEVRISGTPINGIIKAGLRTIGIPKTISSLMLNRTGKNDI
jgi:hypothetical protein